jgi:hypothetical protein
MLNMRPYTTKDANSASKFQSALIARSRNFLARLAEQLWSYGNLLQGPDF